MIVGGSGEKNRDFENRCSAQTLWITFFSSIRACQKRPRLRCHPEMGPSSRPAKSPICLQSGGGLGGARGTRVGLVDSLAMGWVTPQEPYLGCWCLRWLIPSHSRHPRRLQTDRQNRRQRKTCLTVSSKTRQKSKNDRSLSGYRLLSRSGPNFHSVTTA